MSDDKPFYAHNHKPAASPQSKPAMHVWTMTKGGHTYRAELRDHAPAFGCELQIFYDGELKVGHLHPNRDWAITEALMRQEALRLRDWTPAK